MYYSSPIIDTSGRHHFISISDTNDVEKGTTILSRVKRKNRINIASSSSKVTTTSPSIDQLYYWCDIQSSSSICVPTRVISIHVIVANTSMIEYECDCVTMCSLR